MRKAIAVNIHRLQLWQRRVRFAWNATDQSSQDGMNCSVVSRDYGRIQCPQNAIYVYCIQSAGTSNHAARLPTMQPAAPTPSTATLSSLWPIKQFRHHEPDRLKAAGDEAGT